jgi:hypothetical protein
LLDAAKPADVGERRAAHAPEDQAADDVDLGEPAMDAADEGRGEAVDHLRDAGLVHQIADEDEHRHRDERETIERIGHALPDQLDREAVPQDVDHGRDHHGQHHRPAEQEEGREGAEQEHGHGRVSPARSASATSAASSASMSSGEASSAKVT